MDNSNEQQGSKFYLVAGILVVGLLLAGIVMYFMKGSLTAKLSSAEVASQDSFQGPAELSTAVQAECQQGAERVIKLAGCADKETEFFKSADNCLNTYYALDDNSQQESSDSEGNYGDLVFSIAKCYFEKDKSSDKAKALLERALSLPDWEVYKGPVTCGSKATVEAYLESLNTPNTKCIKSTEISSIADALKAQNFSVIQSLVYPVEVIEQGVVDSDVSCPEKLSNIERTMKDHLKGAFNVAQSKADQPASEDAFLDFNQGDNRVMSLRLKPDLQGCLHFQAVLLPSQDRF